MAIWNVPKDTPYQLTRAIDVIFVQLEATVITLMLIPVKIVQMDKQHPEKEVQAHYVTQVIIKHFYIKSTLNTNILDTTVLPVLLVHLNYMWLLSYCSEISFIPLFNKVV